MRLGAVAVKMSFKASGVGRVAAELRQVAERTSDGARGQMKRAAARIVDRAQIYVPEDTTALRESIRIEKTYEGRGRLAIDVVAGNATAIMESGKLINLDQYAWIIHERYSQFKPGRRTREKMSENPTAQIGEGFMTRAYEDEEERLERQMVETVTNIIRSIMV